MTIPVNTSLPRKLSKIAIRARINPAGKKQPIFLPFYQHEPIHRHCIDK